MLEVFYFISAFKNTPGVIVKDFLMEKNKFFRKLEELYFH